MRKSLYLILLDIVFLIISLWIILGFWPGNIYDFIVRRYEAIIIFMGIWVSMSLLFRKYNPDVSEYIFIAKRTVLSNFSALVVTTTLMYLFRYLDLSRFVVFGTVLGATFFNLIMYAFWLLIRQSVEIKEVLPTMPQDSQDNFSESEQYLDQDVPDDPEKLKSVRWAMEQELGTDAYLFLSRVLKLTSDTTLIVATTTQFNIDNQPSGYFNAIVNLKRVNDIRWINKFFEAVNTKLPQGGLFICVAETKNQRKTRILNKYPVGFNYLFYIFDFIIKRVLPKFSFTKGIYFFLTRGQNRVLSRAEILGRLYSCGFEAVREEFIQGNYYAVCKKTSIPAYDDEATYGPLIKLRRIGMHGKIIKVYKMRTMHPYAEYLQEYMYAKHSLQEGGKFKEDFRVSTLGRLMRRLWIDELPMLINLLKGELKIVGVRPLSKHYFNLYTKDLQKKRIRVKPGLIPPFYADNPKTLEEIMESENRYLDSYLRSPLWTDFKYFFLAFYNILVRRYRSN